MCCLFARPHSRVFSRFVEFCCCRQYVLREGHVSTPSVTPAMRWGMLAVLPSSRGCSTAARCPTRPLSPFVEDSDSPGGPLVLLAGRLHFYRF